MQRARLNPFVRSLSIFFPCYNDARTMPQLVGRAIDAIDQAGVEGEVIVVNDGSTDDSAEVLASLASSESRLRVITHDRNRGYGAALLSGFANATNEWVFYTDGDGQYDPMELLLLVKEAGPDVDIVQGYKDGRSDNMVRRIIGRIYHHTVKFLFRLKVRDTDCDFRLIRRSVLDRVALTETTGAICVEMMRRFQDSGARFVEVPVSHHPRLHGRSMFFRPVRLARSIVNLGVLWLRLVVFKRGSSGPSPA